MIKMTVDHVKVNNVNNLRTVVLKEKESDRYLPIWIGQAEGDAIAMRLEGQETPRPMTHSVMDTMIRDLGGEVTGVENEGGGRGCYVLALSGSRVGSSGKSEKSLSLVKRTSTP